MSVYSVLIVDDDVEFGRFVKRAISGMGHTVEEFPSPREFMRRYDKLAPDIIFLDIFMPELSGVEVTKWLSEKHFNGKLVLMTGRDPSVMAAAQQIAERRSEANVATLEKPFRVKEIRALLN